MPYTYNADVWCDECGQAIMARIRQEEPAKVPEATDDETSYDSGDWPKHYDPDYEEADSPQHCGSGNCAGDHGTFLQNRLTSDGYQGLKARLDKEGESLSPVLQEQAEFYGFSYFQNPYESAHDWLEKHLQAIGERSDNAVEGPLKSSQAAAVHRMYTVARDLAGAVDADTIQDLFQSDMDSDGYFKKTGWYSDEMEGC